MKRILPLILAALLLLTGCGASANTAPQTTPPATDVLFRQITQEQAKSMMDAQNVIILDVREQNEFDAGHIPNAVLLPVDTIDEATASEVIPAKNSTVLVYCRSGNRSKTASQKLANMGYTEIYEFGGINTWPYEIVEN